MIYSRTKGACEPGAMTADDQFRPARKGLFSKWLVCYENHNTNNKERNLQLVWKTWTQMNISLSHTWNAKHSRLFCLIRKKNLWCLHYYWNGPTHNAFWEGSTHSPSAKGTTINALSTKTVFVRCWDTPTDSDSWNFTKQTREVTGKGESLEEKQRCCAKRRQSRSHNSSPSVSSVQLQVCDKG